MAVPPVSIAVSVSQKDIDRVTKRLDKYQGAELAKRTAKAIQGGLSLMVAPIRAGAARHRITGETERSTKVKKLRKRGQEMVAYKVGVNTWYGHFPISKDPGSDPYVDAAWAANETQVMRFIDEQIRKT